MNGKRAASVVLIVLVLATLACGGTWEERLADDPGPAGKEVEGMFWSVLAGETDDLARLRWIKAHPSCEVVDIHTQAGADGVRLHLAYTCE